ncbi:MAG: OmpH family outer membrane protein [Geminicoccaceae bacterium]
MWVRHLIPFCLVALLVLGTGLARPAMAQEAANGDGELLPPAVVAVIDYQHILRESVAAQNIRSQIEAKSAAYQEQVTADEQSLRERDAELSKQRSLLSPEAFAEKREAFQSDVAEVQRKVQAQRAELDEASAYALNEVKKALIQIISDLAQQKGFNVVLPNSEVLFFATRLDLTEQVLTRLNEDLPEVEVPGLEG